MGFFYANITLQSTDQQAVALYLNSIRRNSFVLPATKGFIIVCDEDSDTQDTPEITILANQLSKQFKCLAIAVINFDDDILWYKLYQNGDVLDEYISNPDYFEAGDHREPQGGNASILCEVFDRPGSVSRVKKILRAPHGDGYLLENDRHCDLAKTLGWNSPYIFLTYRELSKGDFGIEDISLFSIPLSRRLLRQFIETDYNSSPFDLDKEIQKLLKRKKKISAIVLYQKHKLCSLIDARNYVDDLEKRAAKE